LLIAGSWHNIVRCTVHDKETRAKERQPYGTLPLLR